ncbi:hypothetical protein BC833DRAFT_658828 [Globomyces pollinis-pini]|nr:hypothetical protein BC833DRAFT_658828 [Globomyces pollinis-pini]
MSELLIETCLVIMGITCVVNLTICANFIRKYTVLKKHYLLYVAVVCFLNGITNAINLLNIWFLQRRLMSTISNSLNVLSILSYVFIEFRLLKIACILDTQITPKTVRIIQYVIMLITFIGFIPYFFVGYLFTNGDRSVFSQWNKYGTLVVTILNQLVSIILGLYMTKIMRKVNHGKLTAQAKQTFDKYLRLSNIYLVCFNIFIILTTILYIILSMIRNTSFATALGHFAISAFSMQIISFALLFESFKCLRFGSDESRQNQTPKTLT